MSLSSDELNYLIWRYLQEVGLEVSAFSLLKEYPTLSTFDSHFGESVPIGSLVNLIQKGLLYTHVDQLVDSNPQRFSLFEALNIEKSINKPLEFKERFQLRSNEEEDHDEEINGNGKRENSPEFIKVLKKTFTFEPSTSSDFNPVVPSVLSYGTKSGQAKIVVILDSTTKEIVLNHSIQDSDITAVAWSPLGHLILTALENGELRLWTADGKLRNVLYLHHTSVIVIRWSPDSNYILTSDVDNVTVVWDAQSGNMVQHFDFARAEGLGTNGSAGSSALTPLGATTPTSSTLTIPGPTESLGIDATWIDETRFIVPGLNGAALVFNIGDRTPLGSLLGHTKSLSVIEFDRTSSLLLTASDDRSIRVWNGTTFNNSSVLIGHSQPVTSASWLNQNYIISTSLDSSIRLWDLRTPSKEIFIEVMDGIPILIAKLSPNKELLVVGTIEATVFVFKIDILEQLKVKLVSEYQSAIVLKKEVKGDVDMVDPKSGGDSATRDLEGDRPEEEEEEENYITSLNWSSDSKQIVITYSRSESVVVKV